MIADSDYLSINLPPGQRSFFSNAACVHIGSWMYIHVYMWVIGRGETRFMGVGEEKLKLGMFFVFIDTDNLNVQTFSFIGVSLIVCNRFLHKILKTPELFACKIKTLFNWGHTILHTYSVFSCHSQKIPIPPKNTCFTYAVAFTVL